MTWAPWGLTTVVMVLAGIGLTKKTRNSDGPEIPEQEQHQTMWTLLWCWALVGLVAIYFPSLFQRKLAMGLVVPWAMLASYGLAHVLSKFDRSTRNLVATLSLCLTSGSSLAWFMREIYYIRNNVSRTTVQSVYFSRDVDRIIDELNIIKGRKIVLAMPGVASPVVEMVDEKPTVTDFKAPVIPDLNPLLSGLTGCYTFAGHWSETPEYDKRRRLAMSIFLDSTSEDKRRSILESIKPDYIVMPNVEAFRNVTLGTNTLPLVDLRTLGTVIYSGNQFVLIKLEW